MSDVLDRHGAIARLLPAGPARSDDGTVFTTGTVYAVDPVARTVQVGVREGTVTLPAIADRYAPGGLARVQLDPIKTRPILVLGAVDPVAPVVLAGVTATAAGAVTIIYQTVSSTIPTTGGTYTAGQSAWVSLDEWGVPFLALGPSTAPIPGWSAPTAPGSGTVVTATATIGPQVSGTWRSDYSRWDSWNTDRYGGASDIYQGSGYSSGLLVGFAGYGDQIVNLGAIAISTIIMQARKTDDGLTATLIVQGSADGTRPGGAPSGSGALAATSPVGSGAVGAMSLPGTICDAFRTGAAKGLIAVGSDYGGFGGTGTPGSFVLQITYTKNA